MTESFDISVWRHISHTILNTEIFILISTNIKILMAQTLLHITAVDVFVAVVR